MRHGGAMARKNAPAAYVVPCAWVLVVIGPEAMRLGRDPLEVPIIGELGRLML